MPQTSHNQPEPTDDADTDALSARQREIVSVLRFRVNLLVFNSSSLTLTRALIVSTEQNAMRAKRTMLGNMRFLGELYKVDMLKV